jgi:hypothetical protein
MNIFALDNSPMRAAPMHCDKHVVKMVLETAQILSTVHHLCETPWANHLYKPTHKNHPCVKWAAETAQNYYWLYQLFESLAGEYTHRYKQNHKSYVKLSHMLRHPPINLCGRRIKQTNRTPFALAMPDVYKFVSDDPVECYRAYYLHEKRDMLTYTKRDKPVWMIQAT